MPPRRDVRIGETRLPRHLQERVNAELQSGERLLWTGRPKIGVAVVRSFPPFVLPFVFPMIVWGMMQPPSVDNTLPLMLDVPAEALVGLFVFFLLAAVLLMTGGLYWVWRSLRQVCYALTDRRAILWRPAGFRRVSIRSFQSKDLANLDRIERPDGSGDLVFSIIPDTFFAAFWRACRLGFMSIPRVREVEQVLRQTLLGKEHERPA